MMAVANEIRRSGCVPPICDSLFSVWARKNCFSNNYTEIHVLHNLGTKSTRIFFLRFQNFCAKFLCTVDYSDSNTWIFIEARRKRNFPCSIRGKSTMNRSDTKEHHCFQKKSQTSKLTISKSTTCVHWIPFFFDKPSEPKDKHFQEGIANCILKLSLYRLNSRVIVRQNDYHHANVNHGNCPSTGGYSIRLCSSIARTRC